MVADLQRLVSGGTSSSRNPVIVASSRVQEAGSTSRPSASSSGTSNLSLPALAERTRGSHPEHLLLPVRVTRPALRVVMVQRKRAFERRNAPGSKGLDFVP